MAYGMDAAPTTSSSLPASQRKTRFGTVLVVWVAVFVWAVLLWSRKSSPRSSSNLHASEIRLRLINGRPAAPIVDVVLAHHDEDISWTMSPRFAALGTVRRTLVYSDAVGDGIPPGAFPVYSGGNCEWPAWLTYLRDNYDDLPDWVVLLHAHESSWHHPPSILDTLTKRLMPDALDDVPSYLNLNQTEAGRPLHFYIVQPNQRELNDDEFRSLWTSLFRGRAPGRSAGKRWTPCGQCILSALAVRRFSSAFYSKMIVSLSEAPFLRRTPSNGGVERKLGCYFFERYWPFLMGGEEDLDGFAEDSTVESNPEGQVARIGRVD
jgi:hypothetical protein